jgi:hypothetical protein
MIFTFFDCWVVGAILLAGYEGMDSPTPQLARGRGAEIPWEDEVLHEADGSEYGG